MGVGGFGVWGGGEGGPGAALGTSGWLLSAPRGAGACCVYRSKNTHLCVNGGWFISRCVAINLRVSASAREVLRERGCREV